MNKYLFTRTKLYLFALLLLAGCHPVDKAPEEAVTKKTVYKTHPGKQEALFSYFLDELRQAEFAIEESEQKSSYSFTNCQTGEDIVLKGKGVSWYYIKRQEAEPEHYYPDFSLHVFRLGSEAEASEALTRIQVAMRAYKRDCSIMGVDEITRNGREIFYFSTRAEMFRGYMRDFAKKIESHR